MAIKECAMPTYSGPSKRLFLLALPLVLAACAGDKASPSKNTSVSSVANISSAAVALSTPAMSSNAASSQALVTAKIKLNQLGFLPSAKKLAVVPDVAATEFRLLKAGTDIVVMTGTLSAAKTWAPSEERVKLADFSSVQDAGDYQLAVDGVAKSHSFAIKADAYKAVNAAAIKAFYYNRASMELKPEYAGVYARPLGHADTEVLIHVSAASAERPTGTKVSSPKGWYDAGDYNKYIVNSGIATYSLLAAYEHFPAYFNDQNLAIPESGNTLPDLLDETLWNLEWMLSMQDPNDGGVYHKLTNLNFDGSVMPDKATSPRYMVQKTTAAALDFAAVMATASRVLKPFDTALSAQMLTAAESAWVWAQANPAIFYQQPADMRTGEYGDRNLSDEWAWAAAELYITTAKDTYYQSMDAANTPATVPSWGDVKGLAWVSLAQHRSQLTAAADQALISSRILGLADSLLAVRATSAYGVSMQTQNFVWGSNSVVLNQALMLIQANRLSGEANYLNAAQDLLDYVLGRNATDFSFVTGFGAKSTLHPHHRPSEADGIAAPIPGFIAGGPQPGQQDKAGCSVSYPSNIPAKSYLDDQCSYASNEIAINWNAPLVYVSAAVQVLTEK